MGERTPRSSALTRLGHAVERAAAILFARSDAQARAAGWQVDTTGRWNTSRVYRDPRYDRLRTRAGPRPRPARPPTALGRPRPGVVRSRVGAEPAVSGDRAAEFGRAFVRTPRPNPLVVAWRWRYELSATATLALLTVRVGALWTVAAALATAAAFAVVPPLRWRFWCVVTQHRVRTGLTQAWVFSRAGRIPMVLWTRPVQEGEQLLLLLRPGLTADDLSAAAPVLAAACWAREVVVVPHPTRAALVRLVVVRYDVAAYPASAA